MLSKVPCKRDLFSASLGKSQSATARKFGDSDESSSEDGTGQSESKTLKSPRQQQSDKTEKSANNKVAKLSLKNLGNALASLASDRRAMAISPRKTKRETHRNTQDSIFSTGNTAATGGTTTTNATATTANTAAIPHTTTVTTAPLWQPASPRPQSHPTDQPNQPASAKPKEATATATATATTIHIGEHTTTKPVADQQKPKPGGAVPLSLLTSEAKQVLEQVQAGREITGDQLAELLVCVQSRGHTVPLTTGLTDTDPR